MKLPQNDARFTWTRHIKNKMLFYNISKARVLSILKRPARKEEGVAQDTVAAMKIHKSSGKIKKETEIWLMYQTKNKKINLISTWRYPGRTKPGDRVPIPEDIAEELANIL